MLLPFNSIPLHLSFLIPDSFDSFLQKRRSYQFRVPIHKKSRLAQVRIDEADNTAQYWPNLGSQQSAIVVGPVSPFPLVKCWADEGGICRLFRCTDFQPTIGPVSALYQADCHFYYGIQFRK